MQKRADIAQIGERADAGRDPAFVFGFGRGKGLPEFSEGVAADHRRQQQPIGPQCAAYLRQRPRQIVDELKGQSGDRKVERFRLQRERLRLEVRQLDSRESIDALVQNVADLIARRTDVGRIFEFSHHRVQPFRDILGDTIEQKCRRTRPQCPRLPRPQQGAVKQDGRDVRIWGHARFGTPVPPFLAIQSWQSSALARSARGRGEQRQKPSL